MDFFRGIPFGTKYLMIFMVVLHILKLTVFDQSFIYYITLNPYLVLEKYELWRLFTSQFFHLDIMHILMNMMTFYQLGNVFENKVGTISFFYHIFVFGLLANLLFVGVAWFMLVGGDKNSYYGSAAGFSGVLFSLMEIDNSMSEGGQRSVFGLFLVPTQFYSWVMLLFTSILLPNVSLLGHASGLVIGLLYRLGLLKWMTPSSGFFSWIEHKLCCCCLRSSGFIASEGDHNQYEPFALFNILTNNENGAEPNDQNEEAFHGRAHTLNGNTADIEQNPGEHQTRNNDPFRGSAHTIGDSPQIPLEQMQWGEN